MNFILSEVSHHTLYKMIIGIIQKNNCHTLATYKKQTDSMGITRDPAMTNKLAAILLD